MPPREVLFEFQQIGAYIKVCAIDPVTGTEAVISGPASADQETLKRNAIKRLDYILARKAGGKA